MRRLSINPSVLSAAGVLGFYLSIFFSTQESLDAEKVIQKEVFESRKDRVRALVPIYSKTIGTAMMSTALLLGSDRAHKAQYASLLALYSVTDRALVKWQEVVAQEVSKRKNAQIRERAATPDDNISPPAPQTNKLLCFDVYSGRYFNVDNVETIRRVINDLNEEMYQEDFVPLNDLYFALGLPPVGWGDDAGWNLENGSIKIHLDAILKDGTPIVTLTLQAEPKGYLR